MRSMRSSCEARIRRVYCPVKRVEEKSELSTTERGGAHEEFPHLMRMPSLWSPFTRWSRLHTYRVCLGDCHTVASFSGPVTCICSHEPIRIMAFLPASWHPIVAATGGSYGWWKSRSMTFLPIGSFPTPMQERITDHSNGEVG